MAIGTMTLVEKSIDGPQKVLYVDQITLVGDSSYPTGGMTGVQAALDALTGDQRAILDVRSVSANGGYLLVWDFANSKLMVYTAGGSAGTAPAELANATSLSGVTFKLVVYSK
jgi:hypothetical protein